MAWHIIDGNRVELPRRHCRARCSVRDECACSHATPLPSPSLPSPQPQPCPAHPRPAQRTSAQPSAPQPSPAQPNPAQPSPSPVTCFVLAPSHPIAPHPTAPPPASSSSSMPPIHTRPARSSRQVPPPHPTPPTTRPALVSHSTTRSPWARQAGVSQRVVRSRKLADSDGGVGRSEMGCCGAGWEADGLRRGGRGGGER